MSFCKETRGKKQPFFHREPSWTPLSSPCSSKVLQGQGLKKKWTRFWIIGFSKSRIRYGSRRCFASCLRLCKTPCFFSIWSFCDFVLKLSFFLCLNPSHVLILCLWPCNRSQGNVPESSTCGREIALRFSTTKMKNSQKRNTCALYDPASRLLENSPCPLNSGSCHGIDLTVLILSDTCAHTHAIKISLVVEAKVVWLLVLLMYLPWPQYVCMLASEDSTPQRESE